MNRTLKVAHCVSSLSIGGLEKVVVDIVNNFDRSKVYPLVFCFKKSQEGYEKALLDSGAELIFLEKKQHYLSHILFLKKIFKKRKIDVVHSHSGVYRDATLAAKLAGVPVILHTDHGRFYPDSRWTRFNHWLFSHYRDKIIAVSEDIRNFMVNATGINPAKFTVIYNGVDTAVYNRVIDIEAKKRELGLGNRDKIIVIVARLAPVKDHKTLFSAFHKVRQGFLPVKLLVIGDGILRNELESLAAELNEKENIIFLGNRADVVELLQVVDIVCLSSLHEGHSITLLEAMASGKPVVATNVGGNPELVMDGQTGYLVPKQDPEEMAQALLELLKNEAEARAMGERARGRVEEEFNINRIVKEYEKVYFDLAREKGIL